MDYLPEEDVRKQLRQINSTYQFDLNDFIDLSFIKKVCKDRPTKAEMREGLERVFDALINCTQTLRNPPSFATQTWMNSLREMREGRPFKPSPSQQGSPAQPARRVFVDTPARSAPSVAAHTASTTTSSAAAAAAAAAAGRVAPPSTAAIEAQQIAEAQRQSLAEVSLNSAPAGAGHTNGSKSLKEALKSTPAGTAGRNASSISGDRNGGAGGAGGGGGRRPKAIAIDGWVHILGAGAAEADWPQQQQQQQQQQQASLTSPALSATPASTLTPSSGSALSSPREQNGSQGAKGQNEVPEPASVSAYTSIPASWAPDQVTNAQTPMYADLARTGGPPVKVAMVQLAMRAGGPLMASLKAKEAWRSGVRAFAKVAFEGPKDVTPTMTKVEGEFMRSVHEEACSAVFGVLVNGEPVHMRNYVIASRQLGLDGWPTEGACINAKVVVRMRTLLGVAASNIGDGVDSLDPKMMQVLCRWLLDLLEDDHSQALACAFVRARVEQAALRLTEFFG